MLVQTPVQIDLLDPINDALAFHDGDPRATISTLLADCAHLREQLLIAKTCLSKGLTPGWSLELERKLRILLELALRSGRP
ncbi:hypothetical protein ABIA25_000715 [Sinorhizobium fredii]|uniref:hypothetical protein n=1 Tax=Rhizobium fredii TaxID=380 RepID=UPI0035172FEC